MKNLRIYLIWLFCLACVTLSVTAHAQVVAGFTADHTSGCAPLVVNFTNTSTGATSYSWNLGNTNTSLFTNATSSYPSPGTYTITLTATGASGSSTYSMQIIVQPPPTISFSATDTAICPGATVTFSNTTNLMASGAGTYTWNFGDGDTSTTQNATHAYAVPGYYSITQTATNSNGCSASLVLNSYIHVLTRPAGLFTTSNTNFCSLPAPVTFTDQTTGSGPFTYAWTFGDGNSSPAASPMHNYANTGLYTVTEIVTDIHNCKDTITVANDVSVQNLVTTMAVPDTGCINQSVQFQNTTAGTGISSYWNFGDGSTDAANNSLHTYDTSGTFTVTLVSYINGCNDTATKQIYIQPAPIVDFTFTPAHPCPAPVNVQFTATAPAGSAYTWNFGDLSPTSSLSSPSHTYDTNCFFSVSLSVISHGCIVVVAHEVKVYNFISVLDSPANIGGCVPLLTLFHTIGLSSSLVFGPPPPSPPPPPYPYPYPVASYYYDFGDGYSDTLPISTHTYMTPGSYNIHYTVITTNGCTINDSEMQYAGTPPVMDYGYATPTHGCSQDPISFYAHAHGSKPILYTYMYIPGPPGQACTACLQGSNDTAEIHRYGAAGVFPSYITFSNNGCPSLDTAHIPITIDSPGAKILPYPLNPPCDSPLHIDLQNASLGATSFEWYFGDGDSSSVMNPSHDYTTTGIFTIKLATYNSRSGCRDTAQEPIRILDYTTAVHATDTILCKNGYSTLNIAYNISNPPPVTLRWYLNYISFSSLIDTTPSITYQFSTLGSYSFILVVIDPRGCDDTMIQKVLAEKPTARLTASPTSVCLPGSALFTDSSFYVATTYPVKHIWTFGDGTVDSTASAALAHAYANAGTYTVQEEIFDDVGCSDTAIRQNYITAHKPVASFAVANPNRCANDTISFINTSTSPGIQSVYWSFGDGTTSTAATPVHSYSVSGTYTVTFVVKDTLGCTDTSVRTAYINISKPHAAFSETPSSGVCVPLIVQFTNTSVNGATYAWSFGNATSSFATNPTNSYSTPGSYTIQLTVTDAHGCKDTTSSHITLYGYTGSFSYTPLSGCPPMNVNFTAAITGIPSITWDFADGSIAGPAATTTAAHIYSTPGKYVPKIILVDSAGCHTSSYGTDTIKVDKVFAGFKQTSPACIYDTVYFTDTSSSMFSPLTNWHWALGDASTSFSHDPYHNYRTSGNFNVTLIATDAAGCKDTVTNTILIHPLPVISAAGDTSICPGDSALVTGSGGVSYVWSPAATVHCTSCNPTFAAAVTPTTYVVVGTDAFGCRNKDSVKIGSKYKTVSHVGPGGQICLGRSISLSDSGAQSYTWYPQSGLSDSHSQFPVATPTGSTTYLAIAKTASCIPDTNYVNVTVDPLPVVTAVGGGIVLAGNKTNLQAYGPDIVYFTWDHADLLSCDSCTNPIATMQQSTWFTVTATNEYGCQDTAGVLVTVLCDKSQVFIPNTFTPNGDGQNDVFYPRGIGIRVVRSFRIYNRWGELVFQRNNINLNDEGNGWDGTFNGAKPVPDTYVYALDAICDDGQPIDWKGDVTLIR